MVYTFSNMLIKDKKIAIAGGGPGGLTLARLLQMNGADVTVYERDQNKDVRVQGGSLDLHDESGLAALRKAGLLDAFKANYRVGADKMRLVDNQAHILYDEHKEKSVKDFGDEHFRPEIDRGPLRDILLASLEPGTVVWNKHILSLEPVGNSWKINFHNGDSTIADIVIGADGANSKVRPFVTSIKPFYVGITAIEGTVYDPEKTAPGINELLEGGKIFAFGNEKSLFVSSKGDGTLGFFPGWKTSESWVRESCPDLMDRGQMLAWFKKEFAEWGDIWHQLFKSDTTNFVVRPQYCMPLDQTWDAHSNITLLGDAAHWMPPYAGEGVNMAMLDALELSECLTNSAFPDVQAAIAGYEKQMLARFAEVGKTTMQQTESLHSPHALSDMMIMFGQAERQ